MKRFEISLTDGQWQQLRKRVEAEEFELSDTDVIRELFIMPETRFQDALNLSGVVEVKEL